MALFNKEGYMCDDEDSSGKRSDVIDAQWEKQQIKTFTAWVNSHLKKVNKSIENLDEDLRSGLNLITLLEVISNEEVAKPERGKMRVHKVSNVNKGLQFISDKGVKLAGIGAEEIVDGNTKMTLGMIWTIILRFLIQDIQIEDQSAKEGLLLWCQRRTEPYKNVNIQNFHNSFKDGLGFCALIHRHRPDLIDYNSLSKLKPRENMTLAFDVAERKLGIPSLLDVEDMVSSAKPDERSVMAYVATYYHAFSASKKTEQAVNKILQLLEKTKQNQDIVSDYETQLKEILEWIEQRVDEFSQQIPFETEEENASAIQTFRQQHLNVEKPSRLEQKNQVTTSYSALQTRLRLSGRPEYEPPKHYALIVLISNWTRLEQVEKDYDKWLLSERKRFEDAQHLVAKFKLKCRTHESWAKDKEAVLRSEDYLAAGISEVRAMSKRHDAFQSDLAAHQPRVECIVRIAEELTQLKYRRMEEVNDRLKQLVDNWDVLGCETKSRTDKLANRLAALERIDNLQLEFAKRVAPFYNWVEQAKEDLQDTHTLHFISDVRDLIDTHNRFKETVVTAETEFNEIRCLVEQLQQEGGDAAASDNPYSLIRMEHLDAEWQELNRLVPQRDSELRNQLAEHEKIEGERKRIAQLANAANDWLVSAQSRLNALSTSSSSSTPANGDSQNGDAAGDGGHGLSLDALREALNQFEEGVHSEFYPEHLKPLDEAVQTLLEEQQIDVLSGGQNPHTAHTVASLRSMAEALLEAANRAKCEVDNQIITRDTKGISEEMLDEYRKSFNHFDKNNNGFLDRFEFKACLLSLGYNLKEDKMAASESQPTNGAARRGSVIGEAEFERIFHLADKNQDGHVTFESFLDFMMKEEANDDTSENIIQAFRVLADEKGYVTEEEIRRELPPEQAQFCIDQMKAYPATAGGPDGDAFEEGALDYIAFSNALYGQNAI